MNAPVAVEATEDAQGDAWSIPLDRIDVSNPHLYQDDTWQPYFARLRRDDPVHYTKDGMYGSYWSVTRYSDIMQVDTSQQVFSSDAMLGGIVIRDVPMDFRAAELHRDGPAEARRTAQDGGADRGADEPAKSCRRRSASGPAASSTSCRAGKRSTGSIACRSS